MEQVFNLHSLRYDTRPDKRFEQGIEPFTRHLNCAGLEPWIFTFFLNDPVV